MTLEIFVFQLLYIVLFITLFVDPSATIYAIILGIGLSLLLKKIIKIPRPNNIDSWGMPSTHSQTYMFLCIYLYFRGYTYYSALIIILWILTFYYKVQSGDHSVDQYLLGAVIGGIFAGILINLKLV